MQIEYLVVSYDDENRHVKLSLRQADILKALANDAELLKQGGGVPDLARGQKKLVCWWYCGEEGVEMLTFTC